MFDFMSVHIEVILDPPPPPTPKKEEKKYTSFPTGLRTINLTIKLIIIIK